MRDNHPRQTEIFLPPPDLRGKNFIGAYKKGHAAGIEGEPVEKNPYALVADTGFGRAFYNTWSRGWHIGTMEKEYNEISQNQDTV